MAKPEAESKKPEVDSSTNPRVHERERRSSSWWSWTKKWRRSDVFDGSTSSSGLQQPVPSRSADQQQQQWPSIMNPPAGYKLVYVPEKAFPTLSSPHERDGGDASSSSRTATRAFSLPNQQDHRPPPFLARSGSDESTLESPDLSSSDMMISFSKRISSNLLQSEKVLSNAVQAPENGYYNLYCEAGEKYLDLDSGNAKEGTSIMAWRFVSPNNPAQTWKFVRQSKDGFLCTLQNKGTDGHFNVDRPTTSDSEGVRRRLVQTNTPVLWQLLPVSANMFKLAMVSDLAEKFSVLTYMDTEGTYNTIQLAPEDSSNENQIWTFTTRGMEH